MTTQEVKIVGNTPFSKEYESIEAAGIGELQEATPVKDTPRKVLSKDDKKGRTIKGMPPKPAPTYKDKYRGEQVG